MGLERPRRNSRPQRRGAAPGSEGTKEGDEIALLLAGQFRAEHQIEELNRIIKRQQPSVVEIRRRILDATERESLDSSVDGFIHTVDHLRLEASDVSSVRRFEDTSDAVKI
jgi:hypothetical protein